MRPMLVPLVGDAESITVVGLCKNAGKTTALCRLLRELDGECLAVTSIGRDGERTDVVTGTEKPEIWVREGTLFATAKGLLPLCDVTVEVVSVTDAYTPLGQVAVFRAKSDGYVQLAGPSAVGQLGPLTETFREWGAERVLIDGAAGRTSLAAAGTGGCALLCVGASMERSAALIAAETAHTCRLFDAPELSFDPGTERFALFAPDGTPLPLELGSDGMPLWAALPRENCILWCSGGVTSPMVRALSQRGAPITVAAPDATHFLFDRGAGDVFFRRGGALRVKQGLRIAAVCANPRSAYGNHLERGELLAALRRAVTVPVVDVKEDEV